ncbi:hypothetical protein [Butyrivibrio sp. VCD2006]|uniref:hypothetical protein n=1 Tax=Butyrivibrio sp. VCD2006 TaxID=1280664 RepID=UPI0003F5EBA5|nr:hypothetical protein [Butyrivibrio sp. VCD2006]
MKKMVAIMMAGVMTFLTPMMVVHAEFNGELNLEDELTSTEAEDNSNELYEGDEEDETI